MSHTNAVYTSDMSDEEWARIEPLLPLARTGAGHPLELDMRMVVNAIFYLVRTGCQWDDLPKSYPNHNSVYYHYSKWTADGTWQAIHKTLRQCVRKQQGRNAEPGAAIIDSQSVKTTETMSTIPVVVRASSISPQFTRCCDDSLPNIQTDSKPCIIRAILLNGLTGIIVARVLSV